MTETTRESLEAHRQSYRRAANRGFKVEGDESAFLAEEIDRLRLELRDLNHGHTQAKARVAQLEGALSAIAAADTHQYRSGYDQSDVDVEEGEYAKLARAALQGKDDA